MRFEAIKITNYRQYRDVNFEFKKSTENDIHIIIASNGVGKTNILNAVNWCLYGDEPHTSGTAISAKEKLPLCNLQALHEAVDKYEDLCRVEVEIIASEGFSSFAILRRATVKAHTRIPIGKDIFQITETLETGDTIIHSSDESKEIVDIYLPKKIREYFYFDGERLLNYFNKDTNNVSHIKDSIYEIAQVNVINKVEGHLTEFEKKYNTDISKVEPDLEKKLEKVEGLEVSITNIKKDIEELNDQITEAEQAIEKADSIINGTESVVDYNKKYNKNKEEIKLNEAKLSKVKENLALFVRKYILLIYLYRKNKATEEYIIDSAKSGAMTLDTSVDVIKQSLKEHKCIVCGNKLNQSEEDHLQSLVDKFMSSTTIQKLTEIKNDVHRGLDIYGYESEKQALYNSIDEYEKKIQELVTENDLLHKRISTVSNVDAIEVEMQRKVNNEKTRDRNIEKRGSYKNELENKKSELEAAKKDYNDALGKSKMCKNLKRHIDFVNSAKIIISAIKNEIVNDVKCRMEKLTMQIFEELIWKKETYGRIELDDNFRLRLYHKATNLSCLDSCSAAEKELLALAFTIAIHTVSGHNNLLFIDTPVGRVSDINRENFAKVLLEISDKKQIILAFTPSEYSDEISYLFNETTVSSVNYLRTDEAVTTIKGM